jgi:hypothetical protein
MKVHPFAVSSRRDLAASLSAARRQAIGDAEREMAKPHQTLR